MDRLLIGIDIGTSSCKAAVFDLDGNALSQASTEYDVLHPAPGYAEQDPDSWWRGACRAVREALAAGRIPAERIAGVGVSGQSWAAVPVDRHGAALDHTPIWMDTRAADIAQEIRERVGFEKLFAVSGNPMEPTYSTAKILWFRRNRPDIYRKTYQFLQSNSYIVLKLTGRFTQDLSQGYGVHAFDMRLGRWDDALCDEIGLDRATLPEISACHEVVGEVTRQAAEEMGLAPGTPVVAGGLDACCSTLGAGVYRVGQAEEQGGTAGGVSACVDKALSHPRLILSFHVTPGTWLLQGGMTGGGGSLRWFLQELGHQESELGRLSGRNAFAVMSEEAAAIPPGAGGLVYLPYMAGERSPIWDPHAKGVFFGLGYDKTRAHMIRAVMEGCAYALEHNIRTVREAGPEVGEMSAIGGSANSEVWTQIKCDVTGKPIRVPSSDTAATLGAAMLAGVGTGLYRNFDKAVSRTVRIVREHEPDMRKHALYLDYYGLYIELYDRLKPLMEQADALAKRQL